MEQNRENLGGLGADINCISICVASCHVISLFFRGYKGHITLSGTQLKARAFILKRVGGWFQNKKKNNWIFSVPLSEKICPFLHLFTSTAIKCVWKHLRGGRWGSGGRKWFGPVVSILRDLSLMWAHDTDVCVFRGAKLVYHQLHFGSQPLHSFSSSSLHLNVSSGLPPHHPGDAGRLGFMCTVCFMVTDIIFK